MTSVVPLRSSVLRRTFKVSRTRSIRRSNGQLKVICNVGKSVQSTEPRDGDINYIKLAETINGRCAMQGFIWGAVKEAFTHKSIMEQLFTKTDGTFDIDYTSAFQLSAVVALVTLGTFFTSVVDPEKASQYENNTFTNEAEMVNARIAMVGFFILSMIHMQS